MSTRLLCTLCVCHISSCLKLSRGYTRLLNVSLLAWNYQKHITQTAFQICICYIVLASSISGVPKAHIAAFFWSWLVFCSIRPISQPFQHHFLCYLLHFRGPQQSLLLPRRPQCFQARRGFHTLFSKAKSSLVKPKELNNCWFNRAFILFQKCIRPSRPIRP